MRKDASFLPFVLMLMLFFAPHAYNEAQASSDAVNDYMDAAEDYMSQKQWDYASYEWRNALTHDPKNVQAHLGLAEALMKSGYPEDAITQLEKAKSLTQNPELEIALGKAYEELGGFGKAAQIYQALLSKNHADVQAFRRLKVIVPKLSSGLKKEVQAMLGKYGQEAKQKAQEAIQKGHYQEASRYAEVASLHYNNLDEANNYGLTMFLAGEHKAAARQFNLLLKHGKDNCNIRANAALVLLGAGQSNTAQKLMEETIGVCEDSKTRARLYNNLGYIYEMSKQPSRARFAYERAVELDPREIKALMNLGYIYQRTHDLKRAIETYKTVLQLKPNSAAAWNQLGFTYELQEKEKPAIEAYKKAIALDSTFKDAYYNLGMLYKKQDKMEKAAEAFKAMSNIEFSELENPSQNPVTQSRLFQYVDLFFAEDTPS